MQSNGSITNTYSKGVFVSLFYYNSIHKNFLNNQSQGNFDRGNFFEKIIAIQDHKRYVFMTFIVVFGSLASIYFVTMNVLNDSVRSEIEYRNELLSKTISTKTSFMFDKMINDIRVISEFVLSNSKENTYFYQNEMERLVSENPLYLFIDVLDESGNSITTIPNVKSLLQKTLIRF